MENTDFGDRRFRHIEFVRDYRDMAENVDPCSLEEANVVCSDTGHPLGLHQPVIDIDLPIRVVPSTTGGHNHLYIDYPMSENDMWRLLDVMVDIGLVEPFFAEASQARGYTSVRLPWVKKPS